MGSVRCVLWAVVVGCVFISADAHAQSRIPKVGLLVPGSESSSKVYLQGLHQGLVEQGFVEEQNISLLYRFANGQIDKLNSLALELVSSGVDLIFAGGDQAAWAAKRAANNVPIVAVACDALAAELISNLSRPGGNLTGVTCINSDLDGKRLELMREVIPGSACY